MALLADHVITPPSTELLGCLEDALSRYHARPPANINLRVGDQIELLLALARDECCEGLAWVRAVTWYPTTSFPEQQTSYVRCEPAWWAVVLEMGVARCAPMAGNSGLPTAAEWAAAAHAVNLDAAAMQRAWCCLRDRDLDRMTVPGVWAPLPTEGGCIGGTMQVTIAMPHCNCEEE